MQITDYIIKKLDPHIQSMYVDYHAREIPEEIQLIDASIRPRENALCIMSPEVYEELLQQDRIPENLYIFLTASEEPVSNREFARKKTTCFVTDLSIIPLYHELQQVLMHLGGSLGNGASDQRDFSDFIWDVLSMRITREDEIRQRFQQYAAGSSGAYRVLVFAFETCPETRTERETFLHQIRDVFPLSQATFYFERVVAIVQGNIIDSDSVMLPVEKIEALEEICKKHKAWCGISNETVNTSVLRTGYLHSKDIIRIGRAMTENKKQRVFLQEIYFDYILMDYCYREFTRIHHHTNYLYLIHPGLSEVIRYDKKHDSNYREILRIWLLNDRNLTRTAQLLHMHRNTIIYKVNKAVELIGDDMENPAIRFRVLWSCMMCEFCEKVLGIQADPIPRV